MSNPPRRSRVLRVLVADDSAIVRDFLKDIIDDEPDMLVVGTAGNGEETVREVQRLKPDLVTMDVIMPRLDGVAATRQIMATQPTPIAIVTNSPVGPEAPTTFNAVAAGAVDVLQKPSRSDFTQSPALRDAFVRKLRNVGYVGVVGIRQRLDGESRESSNPPARGGVQTTLPLKASIIAIGCSTGGPPAVRSVLSLMDPEKSPPVVLVQHMSPDFLVSFASWLDGVCPLKVQLATHGAPLRPGHVYVSPGDKHLTASLRNVALNDGPPVHFQKPAADVLLSSVAKSHGDSAIGIVLTGMGRDGASGLLEMHDRGSCTITQDETSSLVYGMPRVAAEIGASRIAASPAHIARLIAHVKHSAS